MASKGTVVNSLASRDFINYEEVRRSLVQQENAWVVFTVIGASILVTLIAIFALYDLCNRFREFINQQIFDGGPPSSPGHHASYTVQIQVDEASVGFDTKKTILKFEFLDSLNQFITNIVVPCFLFRFKSRNKSRNITGPESPPIVQVPDPLPQNALSAPNLNPQAHKSLSAYYDTWQNLVRSSVLSFSLIRRLPMQNLNSIRVSHDCFAPDAYISLKHVIVRDDLQRTGCRVDLQNKHLRALHICPPSSYQVFPAEPVEIMKELNETKSWVQLLTVPEMIALLLVYYQLALIFSPFIFEWLQAKDDIKSCLILGLTVAAFTVIVSTILLTIYLYLRRTVSNPFKINQLSTILLILTLAICAVLCFYAIFEIFELRKEHVNFSLYLILILLVAGTTMTLLLIAATAILAYLKVVPDQRPSQIELGVLST